MRVHAILEVEVIEDPGAAAVALDPLRARILAELREPASATVLAERVGLSRQKVNYHVRWSPPVAVERASCAW